MLLLFCVLANETTFCPTDLPPGIKNCPEASFTVSVTQTLFWERRVNVNQSFCYENNNNNNKKELMVGKRCAAWCHVKLRFSATVFCTDSRLNLTLNHWEICCVLAEGCPSHNDFWEILLKSCRSCSPIILQSFFSFWHLSAITETDWMWELSKYYISGPWFCKINNHRCKTLSAVGKKANVSFKSMQR